CDGVRPPWEELALLVEDLCSVKPVFHWAGLWQDVEQGAFEFIFAATIEETEPSYRAEWIMARNAPLVGLDSRYVERVRKDYARDPVWTIIHQPTSVDTLVVEKEIEHDSR
ncbi:MAG: hypothetical protein K8I60_11265, partial [Anaerolineae bacterium]|nr:hypothetical protein [Anaerolineae bacterium]